MRCLPALLAITILGASTASAATARADEPSIEAKREAFLDERRGIMIGVGAWSAASLAGGAILLATDPLSPSKDPKRRAFRQSFAAMALTYGLINGALAIGTLAAIPHERETLTSASMIDFRRRQSAYVFAINVGLDMIYTAVGAWLWKTGPTATARGTGAGFVVQGGFLVVYDTVGSMIYQY
jgi:hypothetical protein